MVVLQGPDDFESDLNQGIKTLHSKGLKVGPGGERHAVNARLEFLSLGQQTWDTPVVVGLAPTNTPPPFGRLA